MAYRKERRLNTGGWLVLTVIFSLLLLLVQRSERKRRNVTAVVMFFVGVIVWRYAQYRLYLDCDGFTPIICSFQWVQQWAAPIAIVTINVSLLTAVLVNVVFWVLFGRSNPPGSSDSIQVFGMND